MADELILTVYALTLVGLSLFALHRVKMVWLYWKHLRRAPPLCPAPLPSGTRVCVQCPLYNEPLVVERLLECVTRLRWEPGALEIQVLDDSTDETPEIVDRWLRQHPERAAIVKHVRRPERVGYKAGALAYGMTLTTAEFFAVFDADFRPEPDFLGTLMPHFHEPHVGVVQARWEFSNRTASLLTRFQAIFLDAHFVVEQAARAAGGLFFNFNGTAGIWRRTALEDAGGWTSDTVTEDLDASYRAQLRGWKFVYLDRYAVPSELPENLTAFKSQQRRWTKGGVQVARKLLSTVLQSNVPARVKREAFSHLTVGFVHPLLILFSILFVPYLLLVGQSPKGVWLVLNPVTVLLTGGFTVAFYMTGQYFRQRRWLEGLAWMVVSPFFLAFGLAMSVTCCVAVVEGLVTRGGEFVRTPKGGRAISAVGLVSRLRSRTWFTAVIAAEFLLGLAMLGGALHFGRHEMLALSAVLVVKAAGFLTMAMVSSQDLFTRSVPARI